MAKQLFLNNFTTVFIAAVKETPTTGTPATELDYGVLRVSDGAAGMLLNPTGGDYYVLTAYKRSGSIESSIEVMRVTAVDNSIPGECRITVQRAQEGTTTQAYVSGDYLSLRFTKGSAESMVQKVAGKGLSTEDYTTAEKSKLAGVAEGATANSTDAQLRDRATHTGTQAITTVSGLQAALDTKVDKVAGKGLSTEDYTTAEKSKLAGVAAGATANSTDAQLRDRATHTGEQAIASVTGLQSALDAKAPTATPTITGLREVRAALPANNIDLATGNVFTKTISGATTLTVSNVPAAGTTASFILDLTNGGSAGITWWAGMKWAGGTVPTLTAAGRDVLGFFTHDGGTTWTGLVLGKDVK
jgi:hypothetical protein